MPDPSDIPILVFLPCYHCPGRVACPGAGAEAPRAPSVPPPCWALHWLRWGTYGPVGEFTPARNSPVLAGSSGLTLAAQLCLPALSCTEVLVPSPPRQKLLSHTAAHKVPNVKPVWVTSHQDDDVGPTRTQPLSSSSRALLRQQTLSSLRNYF